MTRSNNARINTKRRARKSNPISLAYQTVTFGKDEPEVMWIDLKRLRWMADQVGARMDVAKFLLLTSEMDESTPVILTKTSVAIERP